jgi:AcrR family transcriptional regulator
MPKLWRETIEAHKRGVHDAILDGTVSLVSEFGLRSVTMSQIAENAGIGRSTLYKYFPDVEAILKAWHERQIARHLQQLRDASARSSHAREQLEAVLEAYALISQQLRGHNAELADFLHRDEQVLEAHNKLHHLIRDLIVRAVEASEVRADVPPDELASYCLHALSAAGSLHSNAGISRLVSVILDGLRTPP